MSLDILELIIHDGLDIWRSGHVLAEEGRVLLVSISFDFLDNATTFSDVTLKLATGLMKSQYQFRIELSSC